VVGRDYYEPSGNGAEAGAAARVEHLRAVVRGRADQTSAAEGWRPRCDPEPPTEVDKDVFGDTDTV